MNDKRRFGHAALSLVVTRRRHRAFSVIAMTLVVGMVQYYASGLLGFSGGAQAQTNSQRGLAIFVNPASENDAPAASAVSSLLRGVADRLAPLGIKRSMLSAPETMGKLAEVSALVQQGRSALIEKNFQSALDLYMKAAKGLNSIPGAADRALTAKVYKGLGIAYLSNGKNVEAKENVKRALTIYPGQKQSEYAYSLGAKNLFAQVQREAQGTDKGSLSVVTEPGNAEVYVDFEFRGFSPLVVEDLFAGEHLLNVYSDGYMSSAGQILIAGSGETDEMVVPLTALAGAKDLSTTVTSLINTAARGQIPKVGLDRVASMTGATDILALNVAMTAEGFKLVGVYRGAQGPQLIDRIIVQDEQTIPNIQAVLSEMIGFAPAMESALEPLEPPPVAVPEASKNFSGDTDAMADGEDLIIDPNSPIFKDTAPKAEQESVVGKWWFWTALVVGLGAIAGATYWGVTSGGDSSSSGPTGGLSINLGGVQ